MQWGSVANGLAMAIAPAQEADASRSSVHASPAALASDHRPSRLQAGVVVAGSLPVLVASADEVAAACQGPSLRETLAFAVVDPGEPTVSGLGAFLRVQ
jgi:hypothetical protein